MTQPLDTTLQALADPSRRTVVELLRGGPRRAGELAEACRLSRPAMSRHLKVLRRCGLVEGRELESDARVRLYQLRPQPFVELQRWLARVEEFWGGQLEAFRRHVEAVDPEAAP